MKKIPRILHLFWALEQDKLSALQAATIYSFRKHNPDFEIHIWVGSSCDKELDRELKKMKKLPGVFFHYNSLKKYDVSRGSTQVQKSDLFRYHILYEIGGFWSDFDILFIRPVENLLIEHACSFDDIDAGLCWNGHDGASLYHSIGFLYAAPGSKTFKEIIEYCKTIPPGGDYQLFGSPRINNIFPDFISAYEKNNYISNIKAHCIYPISWKDCHQYYSAAQDEAVQLIDKDVVGLHWFYGSKFSKAYLKQGCNNPQSIINRFCQELEINLN